MNGLEIPDLQVIHILRHLPEEERSSIKFVHIYGSCRNSFEGPSALYVNTNDEVFLAGFDSLVGKSCTENVPTWRKGVLEKSVKVEELSGKSVQRIVVGEEFGAALTTSKDLYLWGTDVGPVGVKLPAGLSRLALESHYHGAKCSKCSQPVIPDSSEPSLSHCIPCGGYQNRVSSLPPPTSWTGRPRNVLVCSATATVPPVTVLICMQCGVIMKYRYHTLIKANLNVVCCSSCHCLFDGDQYMIPPQNNPAPHKVTFPSHLTIVDIAAGKTFLLIQTSSQLFIWGGLGEKKYNQHILNPDNVSFTKVACGSAQIAVITDQGDLYTCGVGDAGQLDYYTKAATANCMSLKKVALKAPAVDVACGSKSTICLLQDGTHVTFGTVTNILSSGTWTMNLFESAVVSVPQAGFNDKVLKSSLNHLLQTGGKCSVKLTGDLVDTFLILYGLKSENSRVTAESSTSVHDAANQTDWTPVRT